MKCSEHPDAPIKVAALGGAVRCFYCNRPLDPGCPVRPPDTEFVQMSPSEPGVHTEYAELQDRLFAELMLPLKFL